MEQKRKLEFTEFEENCKDLGKWGKFFAKYIIPEERTVVGEWIATYGDKPVPATLTYVPFDVEEEAKLLNDEHAKASDFFYMGWDDGWDDWTIQCDGKEYHKNDEREIAPKVVETIYTTEYEDRDKSMLTVHLKPYGTFIAETMRLYNNWDTCLYGAWYPSDLSILPEGAYGVYAELYFTIDDPKGVYSGAYNHVSDGVIRCWEQWDDIKPVLEPLKLITDEKLITDDYELENDLGEER